MRHLPEFLTSALVRTLLDQGQFHHAVRKKKGRCARPSQGNYELDGASSVAPEWLSGLVVRLQAVHANVFQHVRRQPGQVLAGPAQSLPAQHKQCQREQQR